MYPGQGYPQQQRGSQPAQQLGGFSGSPHPSPVRQTHELSRYLPSHEELRQENARFRPPEQGTQQQQNQQLHADTNFMGVNRNETLIAPQGYYPARPGYNQPPLDLSVPTYKRSTLDVPTLTPAGGKYASPFYVTFGIQRAPPHVSYGELLDGMLSPTAERAGQVVSTNRHNQLPHQRPPSEEITQIYYTVEDLNAGTQTTTMASVTEGTRLPLPEGNFRIRAQCGTGYTLGAPVVATYVIRDLRVTNDDALNRSPHSYLVGMQDHSPQHDELFRDERHGQERGQQFSHQGTVPQHRENASPLFDSGAYQQQQQQQAQAQHQPALRSPLQTPSSPTPPAGGFGDQGDQQQHQSGLATPKPSSPLMTPGVPTSSQRHLQRELSARDVQQQRREPGISPQPQPREGDEEYGTLTPQQPLPQQEEFVPIDGGWIEPKTSGALPTTQREQAPFNERSNTNRQFIPDGYERGHHHPQQQQPSGYHHEQFEQSAVSPQHVSDATSNRLFRPQQHAVARPSPQRQQQPPTSSLPQQSPSNALGGEQSLRISGVIAGLVEEQTMHSSHAHGTTQPQGDPPSTVPQEEYEDVADDYTAAERMERRGQQASSSLSPIRTGRSSAELTVAEQPTSIETSKMFSMTLSLPDRGRWLYGFGAQTTSLIEKQRKLPVCMQFEYSYAPRDQDIVSVGDGNDRRMLCGMQVVDAEVVERREDALLPDGGNALTFPFVACLETNMVGGSKKKCSAFRTSTFSSLHPQQGGGLAISREHFGPALESPLSGVTFTVEESFSGVVAFRPISTSIAESAVMRSPSIAGDSTRYKGRYPSSGRRDDFYSSPNKRSSDDFGDGNDAMASHAEHGSPNQQNPIINVEELESSLGGSLLPVLQFEHDPEPTSAYHDERRESAMVDGDESCSCFARVTTSQGPLVTAEVLEVWPGDVFSMYFDTKRSTSSPTSGSPSSRQPQSATDLVFTQNGQVFCRFPVPGPVVAAGGLNNLALALRLVQDGFSRRRSGMDESFSGATSVGAISNLKPLGHRDEVVAIMKDCVLQQVGSGTSSPRRAGGTGVGSSSARTHAVLEAVSTRTQDSSGSSSHSANHVVIRASVVGSSLASTVSRIPLLTQQ